MEKMTLWMGWLMCGACVVVAASEGKRGARVSSARLTRGAKVAATAGELRAHGRRWAASWAARTSGECGCGWAAARWRAEKPSRPGLRGLLLFLFPFFFSYPLFEFKFGLEFEFKTEVTYSLEFREFCLIITLWVITLMELLNIA